MITALISLLQMAVSLCPAKIAREAEAQKKIQKYHYMIGRHRQSERFPLVFLLFIMKEVQWKERGWTYCFEGLMASTFLSKGCRRGAAASVEVDCR